MLIRNLFSVVLSVFLLARVDATAANPWPESQYFFRQYGTSADAMNARVFKPLSFDPNSAIKHPVVIYFHGDGENEQNFTFGNPNVGNSRQMLDAGQYVFVTQANQAIFPCFFVLAQRQGPNRPGSLDDGAMAIIDGLEADPEFRAASGASKVDRDRLHLTGLSGGGGAGVIIAGQRPGVFASGVFICPPIPPSPWWVPGNMSGLNAWFFHALGDEVVTWRCSREMVNDMRELGARPIFTRYGNPDFEPGNEGSHGIAAHAYVTPYLIPWMAAQRRGIPSSADPATVGFVLPGPDLQHTSSSVFVNFSGTTGQLAAAAPALNAVWFSRNDFVDIHRPAGDTVANYQPTGGTVGNWSFSNGEAVNQWNANPMKFYVVATGTTWNSALGGVTYYSDTLLLTKLTTGAVDATVPTLTFVSPTTGSTHTTQSPSVEVLGAAADNAGVVHVRWTNDRGGSGFAEGTTNWRATIPLQSGANVLTFKVYDSWGNTATKTLTVTRSAIQPPASGPGLLATYFNNSDLTGSSISRVDPQISFFWAGGSPDPGIDANTFSARWEGRIQVAVSGTYTFTVGSDDGSRLWIDGVRVIDHWSDHSHTQRSGTVVLEAGRKYPIKMEFYEGYVDASAELRWTKPDGTNEVVPTSALLLPAPNGLVGTYFDQSDLTNSIFSRVDPKISFNWGNGSPDPSLGADTFSVRWEGQIEAPTTGVYTFEIGSDDGSRLYINDTLVVNHWSDHGYSVLSGTIALNAGQRYPIRMEYYEGYVTASAELKWTPPSGTSAVVPTNVLFADVDGEEDIEPPLSPSSAVRYDFGGSDVPTTETGWNNITNVTVGTGVTNSVDVAGNSTGIGLSIVQAFGGVNTQGSTSAGIYPASATRDSVFVNSGSTGKLRLSGLDPATKYKLIFFASRTASDNVRVTKYTVGSSSVTLDAAIGGGNTSTTAALTGIVPSGSGTVDIDVTNNPGSTFGYLGVLEVQRETASQAGSSGAAPSLVSAVSRQPHGSSGTFDIALPISGSSGVECRQLANGAASVVFTFSKPIVSGTVALTGIGSVSGSPVVAGDKMTVSLSGLADGQTVQLNVTGVVPKDGGPPGSASVVFKVLAGDANSDGIVSDVDVNLVKTKLASLIGPTNAFADVNRNGSLNTADVLLVSSRRGGSAL